MEIWKQTCYNSREPFSRRRLALGFSRKVRGKSAAAARTSGGSAPTTATISARTSGGGAPTARAKVARTSARTLREIGQSRRAELTKIMRKSSSTVVSRRTLEEVTAHAWTPTMQHEENLMKRRRATRILETAAAGTHVPSKHLAGFSREELCELYEADQERLRAVRNKQHARKRLAFAPRAEQDLRGKSVFFVSASAARMCTPAASSLHLRVVTDLAEADLVCSDVGAMSLSTKAHVFLRGGFIVQPEFLSTHGKQGSFLHVRPALQVQHRQIWVSGAAAEAEPRTFLTFADAIASGGSKWTWFVGSNYEFLRRATRTSRLIGIVTAGEYAAFPKGFANVMTFRQFLSRVVVYDTTKTQV